MSLLEKSDSSSGTSAFDVEKIRRQFPILEQDVHGHRLVYLDNAATTQKPRAVIDAICDYYSRDNSNIHRGVHTLSQRATRAYEAVRDKLVALLGGGSPNQFVFVRGTTEAVNMVAQSFVRPRLEPGDEIVLTAMEHHSNIVPWQMLRDACGCVLRVVPIDDRGCVDLDRYRDALGPRTRFVTLVHVSNALGTINPVKEMCALAEERGIPVLVDGAQAVAHAPVDLDSLRCDFYCLSAHKLYGPTGIGALWAKTEHLETMQPYQGGGDMIASVTFEKTTYNRVPHRFEAGTPNIAGTIGFGAAIDWLREVGLEAIVAHEDDVLDYATELVSRMDGVRLIGEAPQKAAVLSFAMGDVHPHDVGTILDQEGIAVRAGHHCAQPVMDRYEVPATVRASFGVYNTRDEVDRLVAGLARVQELFS